MLLMIMDEDPFILNNLGNLLNGRAGITVTGAFMDCRDALNSLESCNPDLLITELGPPVMNGIEFITKVKRILPDIEILVYSVFDERSIVLSALM